MKVFVAGGSGMLGSDLVAELSAREYEVIAPPATEFDITDPMSVARLGLEEYSGLDACVNCAAYTAVDKAEEDRDQAFRVNALGAGYLAKACSMAGVAFVHLSTDFIFDGSKKSPYTEEDPTNPPGAYGESKREGEESVLAAHPTAYIVRTAWLFGPNGHCFPRTMIRAWLAGKHLRVVSDQIGTPTYTVDLARVIVDLLEKRPMPGIYHAAGPDVLNWHELALRSIRAFRDEVLHEERPIEVEPILTEDWPTPARRPAYSALSTEKLLLAGIEKMRPIDETLAEFVQRLDVV